MSRRSSTRRGKSRLPAVFIQSAVPLGRDGLTRGLGLALFVVAAAPAAQAQTVHLVTLPPLPNFYLSSSNLLGTGGQFTSGLATRLQGAVYAETRGVGNPAKEGDSYTSLLAWQNDPWAPPFERKDGRSLTVLSDMPETPAAVTYGHSTAVAAFGRLRAEAVIVGGGGYNYGFANAGAMFVDTVTLGRGGHYTIDWDVHGTVTGGAGPGRETTDYATARIAAKVWWVPYVVGLGQGPQSSAGSYYQESIWEYNHLTGKTKLTGNSIKPDFGAQHAFDVFEKEGTQFWIVGLLEVEATRQSSGSYQASYQSGVANFMNTVNMTIESLDFPGTSDVISSSGHDYSRPKPPPPLLAITGCSHNPGTGMEITYSAPAGASVTLQRSADLLEWTALATAVVGESGTGVAVDPNPPPGRAYYRLSTL